MVSNSNPRRRDPLTLAVSHDGLVFKHLSYLVGGRHVDSGAKQTMEVLKVSPDDLDRQLGAGGVLGRRLAPW